MRVATFNVENLFDRPRIMNLDDWDDGRPVLDQYNELSDLLEKPIYATADKARMIQLLTALGLARSDTGPFVILRRNRGSLVTRRRNGQLEIKARGRSDWIGWLELRDAPVNATAILNTARVIRDLDADILGLVEAEHRIALAEFNRDLLPVVAGQPYRNIMLIDGNDSRGIDVGLMTRDGYDIGLMRSHVDLRENGIPVFSRDCPEFQVRTPAGETIWVLLNHLKSKGYGRPADNDSRRQKQADYIAQFYRRLHDAGESLIIVMGDLNDTPDSDPLRPLLRATDLRDATEHSTFDPGEFAGRGTFRLGNDQDKIDYLLLSPALFDRVRASGIFRKGAWPGSRPRRWTVYPELVGKIHAASDHHALWADIE